MSWRRIAQLLRKELLQIRRDRRMIGLIFMAPLIQLFVLGYAVTNDISHIATAIYDEDHTSTSRDLIERFSSSGYFDENYYIDSPAQANALLDADKASFVLHIPRGFTKDLARGRTAELQTLYDGSDASTARIIAGYVSALLQQYTAAQSAARLGRIRLTVAQIPSIDGRVSVWYNPELRSVNFLIPGILVTTLLYITTSLTSLAIVREKELGTLEQIIVTPLTPLELMIGKTVPFLLIGFIDLILALCIAIFWFHVRMVGNVFLLFFQSLLFIFATLGLGTFISTVSKTQQESSLTSVLFLIPFVMLSGFIFPIDNMPPVIQWLTYLDPLRYYLQIIRQLFLKGSGLNYLWPQTLALAVLGVGILLLSAMRFSKRLS